MGSMTVTVVRPEAIVNGIKPSYEAVAKFCMCRDACINNEDRRPTSAVCGAIAIIERKVRLVDSILTPTRRDAGACAVR